MSSCKLKCKICGIEIKSPITGLSFVSKQPICLGEFCDECFEEILEELEKESEEEEDEW